MVFIKRILIFLMGCLCTSIGSAQTISTNYSSSLCIDYDTDISGTITGKDVPDNITKVVWSYNTSSGQYIIFSNSDKYSTDFTVKNINGSNPVTIIFTADYYKTANGSITSSASTTFKIYYPPGNITPKIISQSIQTTASPIDLTDFFNNPYNGTLYFTDNSGFSNVINGNKFDPSKITSGLPQTVTVTCHAYYSPGCENTATTSIQVIDGNISIPFFLRPLDPLPICLNKRNFVFEIISSCNNGISYQLSYDGLNWGSLINVTTNTIDNFTGLYLYQFSLNPSLVTSANYRIGIQVFNSGCDHAFQSGFIPVTPVTPLTIFGLNPNGGPLIANSTVDICPASLDIITMEGFPSGGTISIYKGEDMTFPTNVTSDPGFGTPVGKDNSHKYFIPQDIFSSSTLADSVKATQFKIVYIYPSSSVGVCQDTFVTYLSFLNRDSTFFEVVSTAPYCYGDSLQLKIINSDPGRMGDSYTWIFSDSSSHTTTQQTYSHFFKSPGIKNIRLKTSLITLPTGKCNNDVQRLLRVGAKPKASFEISANFVGVQSSLSSTAVIPILNKDPTTSNNPDVINQWFWSWDYRKDKIFVRSYTKDTVHVYTSTSSVPAEVTHVVMSGWGCTDTIVRPIPIFPIQKLEASKATLYTFDDQSHSLGWFESSQYRMKSNLLSSWIRMVPMGRNIKSNDSCWITSKVRMNFNRDTTGYYDNEHSWVESPCFDLSVLDLPMVSFNTWTQSDFQFDGATFQYTLCDSVFGKEKWTTLGEVGKGIDWYNSAIIVSSPGGSPSSGPNLFGWSGATKGWKSSAYRLNQVRDSAIKNNRYVRFRIAFASNSDNTPNEVFDGFSFDNFYVGQRNRKVLVEEFCDYKNYETVFQGNPLDPQIIRLQYHVQNENPDDHINNLNTADPSARASLYGIDRIPRAVVDGVGFNDTPFYSMTGNKTEWGPDAFFIRSLQLSPFDINVMHTVHNNNSLSISTYIQKISTTINPNTSLVAQIAVVEDTVISNGILFTNVVRKLIPDASGHHIGKWSKDEKFTVEWKPLVKPQSGLKIVVFLQDENTKEIYQAGIDSVSKSIATEFSIGRVADLSFDPNIINTLILFPNPTSADIHLTFNQELSENASWRITDVYGTSVLTGSIPFGNSKSSIDTSVLSNGLYHIQLESSGHKVSKTFTVIR